MGSYLILEIPSWAYRGREPEPWREAGGGVGRDGGVSWPGGWLFMTSLSCCAKRVAAAHRAIPVLPGGGGTEWGSRLGCLLAPRAWRWRVQRLSGAREGGGERVSLCQDAGPLAGHSLLSMGNQQAGASTRTSRSLARHWQLSRAREGCPVGGKVGKRGWIFQGQRSPGR